MTSHAEEFRAVADDVVLGSGVRLSRFVNLYGSFSLIVSPTHVPLSIALNSAESREVAQQCALFVHFGFAGARQP